MQGCIDENAANKKYLAEKVFEDQPLLYLFTDLERDLAIAVYF